MQTAQLDIEYKRPPRTALEVFEMLPEGTLAEVIDNTIYMPPSPDAWHQRTSLKLVVSMYTHVVALNLGECFAAPMDVYLDNRTVVEPDILFIATENLGIIKDGKIKGVPDLIVEILSGNQKYDTKTKKDLYEAFGVKEYFIVDPETKETITYYLDGQKYIKQKSEKGKIVSRMLAKEFEFSF